MNGEDLQESNKILYLDKELKWYMDYFRMVYINSFVRRKLREFLFGVFNFLSDVEGKLSGKSDKVIQSL